MSLLEETRAADHVTPVLSPLPSSHLQLADLCPGLHHHSISRGALAPSVSAPNSV